MENTLTQHLTAEKIGQCRKILYKIQRSVDADYLPETWKEDKENNYSNIVLTYSEYYAFESDCVEVEGEWLHEELDEEEYKWDEIDECNILEENACYVLDGRHGGFYTHTDNCHSSHDIYEYDNEYISADYMENHSLVFDCDGDICHTDDVYYWECDGEYHHSPEYGDDEDEDDEYSLINGYSYKPSPKYYRLNNDNDKTPFFGIELEVERRNSNEIRHSEMAEKIQNDHWYFKTDGSLTDGFEIVTHPLTFNYIKQCEKTFEDSLRMLADNGYNSYNANTCGMHIHITKKCFSTWHLYRFLKFFVENKEFIVAISQRKLEKLKKWANIEDDSENELIYKAKKKDGNNERYVAVNLRNNATIEIRIFRGTLNFNSFMKNIEFAHSVFMYTKENNEISLNGFKEYLKYSKDYSNLKKFISLKNL